MKNLLRSLLTITMMTSLLLGAFRPAFAVAPPNPESNPLINGMNIENKTNFVKKIIPTGENPETKIEPFLLKQLKTETQVDFIIWLSAKADLSPADQLKTKAEKGQFVFETLRAFAESSQKDLREYLDSRGIRYAPYYIANKIWVRGGDQNLVYSLAGRPEVSQITANHYYQLIEPKVEPPKIESPTAIEPNLSFLRTDAVWALGITGEGVVLAGNDTGLDWEHLSIKSHYRGWDGSSADHNYNWWDTTGTFPNGPGDDMGHGTHTTGTMVGDDGGSNQIGMAPGAQTIHCKNMDSGGGGSDSNFIECFQWDLAPWDLGGNNPRPDLAPDAVNNSWGYWGGGYPDFADEIAALQAAGILVEVSAGNEGPSCSTLRSPGDYAEVLTTGSVNHASGVLPGSLTDFSSRGPSSLSGEFMPDIMAPGEYIRSAVPGDQYEYWSGTSMAGPHVTGLIGLLWSANPALQGMVAETQQIIFQTAVPLAGQTGSNCGGDYTLGPNNDWGYGTFDALAAVEAAMTFGGTGTLEGTVSDSVTSDPLEDVQIRASLTPTLTWRIQTDENGYYSRLVFSGTYTVTSQLYGYYPEEISSVQVISGTTTTLDIAMDPAPVYLVSGQVIDAAAGWPLYARIDIAGYPHGPVWSDPVTGDYSVSLAAGIEYTFKVTPWSDGYTSVSRVIAPLTGDQTEDFAVQADLTACTAPGYSPEYTYFENFEYDDGDYTTTGSASWEWGIPTSGPGEAHSGQSAWATNLSGNYSDNEYGSIGSPDIDLSSLGNLLTGGGGGGGSATLILNWWQWLQTEECCDFGSVDISNDGGASWTTVYGPVSGSVDTEWTKYTVYMDESYAVNNFRIRFNFSSDYSVTEAGFYVDDIGIGVAQSPPVLYSDDFEADNGGYSTSGVTSWEWGTPTRGPSGAHSGINVWATNLDGNYGDDENGDLTSPAIDLSSFPSLSTTGGGEPISPLLQLSWWQWLQTESGYDFASVEVSDGISWTEVISVSGIIDTDWSPASILLDPAQYAVSNFRVRFHLQSDGSVTYPGFYVDDVKVDVFTGEEPHVPCNMLTGGLVVGNVYDMNTAAGLNGATVMGSIGIAASKETPDDPIIDDGFYTLFAPAGPETLTATMPSYAPQVETPTVLISDTIRQDFNLPAGILATNPATLEASLDMGYSTTLILSLENLGSLAVDFKAREQGGAYLPDIPLSVVVPANQVPATPAGSASAYNAQSNQPLKARPSFTYTPPTHYPLAASELKVLLVFAADVYQIQAMLQAYPDLSQVDFFDAMNGTPTLAELQAYDTLVVGANFGFADPIGLGNVLADYVDAGGSVVQTVPTFDSSSQWGIQGRFADEGYSPFAWTGDWFSWADLGDYDPAHPIMENVSYAGDYFRQMLDTTSESEWVANWTDDEFVVTKGSVVAMNTFLPDGYGWEGDIPLIVHNSIVWLQSAGDVPWLSTDPITGTVPVLGTQDIVVTFDASVPEVTQPGQYSAALKYTNDAPYGPVVVPVTMTVNVPADWGRLTGVINSLGYCDLTSTPLDGATVEIHELGVTTQSYPDGTYSYWMPAGNYSVTVSAEDYLPYDFAVTILAGDQTVQDIELRLDAPCSAVSAERFSVTIVQGTMMTETLQLSNTGAGDLLAQFLESYSDLSLISPTSAAPGSSIQGPSLIGQSGPTSVRGLAEQTGASPAVDLPLGGWFGALDLPEGVIRYAAAQCPELPESFFVFAGVNSNFSITNKAWRYDTATNSWNALADLPWGSEAPAAACYQGKIYVMGGDGSNAFLIYDLVSDSWSVGPSLTRNVEGAAAAAWDGRVYLVGGDNDFYPGNGVSDEVNIYDIATGTWIDNGSPLPVATGNAGFTQIGSYLYIAGGWGEMAPTQNISATQRYDMENDTWELGPDFTSARSDFALAATDQAIYAIGGDKNGQTYFDATDTVERFDLSNWLGGSWEELGDPLPVAFTANNAGFCTQDLITPDTAEVWSVGGLDTDWYVITGRTLFHEMSGETCFSIYTDIPWLTEVPSISTIPGDEGQSIQVVFDGTNLEIGEYRATLAISTNDPGMPLYYLPVYLTVRGPYPILLPVIYR